MSLIEAISKHLLGAETLASSAESAISENHINMLVNKLLTLEPTDRWIDRQADTCFMVY